MIASAAANSTKMFKTITPLIDENFVVEDRVKNQIYSQLRRKFPPSEFAVMKGTDVNTRLLEAAEARYFEERGEATTTSYQPKMKMKGRDTGVLSNIVNGVGDFLSGHRDDVDNGWRKNDK